MKLRFILKRGKWFLLCRQVADVLRAQGQHAEIEKGGLSKIRRVAHDTGPDVLVVDEWSAQGYEPGMCSVPVVMLDQNDSSILANRKMLAAPEVKLWLKASALRPRTLYNETDKRYHQMLLAQYGIGPPWKRERPQSLSAEVLHKIEPWQSHGSHQHVLKRRWPEPKWNEPRRVDVHFAGSLNYKYQEMRVQRLCACQEAARWGGPKVALRGRRLGRSQYYQSLRESKTVLSPFGYGETAHRDWEAWLCGALLIKPRMDWCQTYQDTLRPGETYLPCALDFSDARKVIARVADDWAAYADMRREAYKTALASISVETLAADFMRLLRVHL